VTPTITLDTCCVSALAIPSPTDDPKEVEALQALVERFEEGTVQLQLAAAYEDDVERDLDAERHRQRLAWEQSLPPIPRAVGVFRLDVSRLDDPLTAFGSERQVELDTALRRLLEPNRRRQANFDLRVGDRDGLAQLVSDVDHLIAHDWSGADWFATTDDGILAKAAELAELGITVGRPTTILASL
jgi:hypothetical protein